MYDIIIRNIFLCNVLLAFTITEDKGRMTEIAYYALELVKFLVDYLFGLSMRLTADRRKRLAAACLFICS